MVLRSALLASCVLPVAIGCAALASAQDLQSRVVPPPAAEGPAPADQQVRFSAGQLDYDSNADIVTATGDVRMYREDQRLRADKVTWNRKTGKVLATGNIATVNAKGDIAYGDQIELTDTLKDGVVENMLVVFAQGGRAAAAKGTREESGTVVLDQAAYTPCAVTGHDGCPKSPSWKLTAVQVVYRPDRQRIYYKGARLHLFGLPGIPLPSLSHPTGGGSESGLLSPDIGYSRANGAEFILPYYFRLAPNRGLTITPHVFSSVLPMLETRYTALGQRGAFDVTAYGTASRRSDDLSSFASDDTTMRFRGYIDAVARYQLTPNWSVSGSLRVATDRTFLRRYDISRDDRLRNTAKVEYIDPNTYFSLSGWAVQTLRVADPQGMQPFALPLLDFRQRFTDGLLGGVGQLQLNTLALTRSDGQDTQRAFAAFQWDLRRLTRWGQEVTLTAYARGDLYHTADTLATSVVSYRGDPGFTPRAIGAVAADIKWPFVGSALGGTQRITPRVQFVAAPHIANTIIPNEDSRALDLEASNLFSLNRFSGYDRFEDSSRVTYGGEYALTLPGLTVNAVIGQSYRVDARPSIFFEGTGLSERFSDIVGRTELRWRDFVSLTHRYRLDKDSLAVRRNEVDATIGTEATYLLLGYLRLDRNIYPAIEDLQDREEVRVAGRVQFARFWSAFASGVIDLTNKDEDPLSQSDGFKPVRHRVGIQYEDDCVRLGVTWRRDYQTTGDARQGNRFLLTLALTNLGR